mmetsp:Transcript_17331/g.42096  ORF Transcript_17331/g.42096 Transcript_17331/m.42096 type:complete len:218 (+) Transcript_17331:221-874(+)
MVLTSSKFSLTHTHTQTQKRERERERHRGLIHSEPMSPLPSIARSARQLNRAHEGNRTAHDHIVCTEANGARWAGVGQFLCSLEGFFVRVLVLYLLLARLRPARGGPPDAWHTYDGDLLIPDLLRRHRCCKRRPSPLPLHDVAPFPLLQDPLDLGLDPLRKRVAPCAAPPLWRVAAPCVLGIHGMVYRQPIPAGEPLLLSEVIVSLDVGGASWDNSR